MMQSILVSIYVLSCILNQLVVSDTKIWYETQMLEKVVPLYKEAFTMLQQNVLNPLLVDISQENEITVKQLVFGLTCSIQRIYYDLNIAVNESQKLHLEIDQKLVDVVAAISAKEEEITSKKGEIHQKTTEVQGAQSELTVAEQALRDKQQSLTDAEHALRIAEQKVDKARRCFGRRRRKRFLGFMKRMWRNVIVKPISSVVNMGGINIAKHARGIANGQLQSAQRQVNEKRQQLSTSQAQQSSLASRLGQLQGDLQTLQTALVPLKDESNSTAIINYELKLSTSHLTSLWDSSAVLYTTIRNLIDFELLIIPLNAIYSELTKSNLLTGSSIEIINNTQLVQAKASLDELASVLPQMPFNTVLDTLNCDTK